MHPQTPRPLRGKGVGVRVLPKFQTYQALK